MSSGTGDLIRQLRLAKGWSQGRLADELCKASRANISREYISQRWESNATEPSAFWLRHLAAVLDCPPELLEANVNRREFLSHPGATSVAPVVASDLLAQGFSARLNPADLGWPFSTWSLSKLAEVLGINGIADISRETLRQILKSGGVSWQATKTWKASNDPEFTTKMARVLDLYDHRPTDGRVVCVDSVHKRAEVRAWCAGNDVELVFVPTYSSWLNRIECEFASLRYFALNGTDHRSPCEQDDAIGAYIRWRNQHADPVRDFDVSSKIRPRITYRRLPDAALAAFILTREGLRLR